MKLQNDNSVNEGTIQTKNTAPDIFNQPFPVENNNDIQSSSINSDENVNQIL